MKRIKSIIRRTSEEWHDLKILYITAVFVLTIMYFFNPLANVDINIWNRTFCSATLAGTSIGRRIGNIYFVFLICIPIIFGSSLLIISSLLHKRREYKGIMLTFSIFFSLPMFVSYFVRYGNYDTITPNILLESFIGFDIVIFTLCIMDREQGLNFSNITLLYVFYEVCIVELSLLFNVDSLRCILFCVLICILVGMIFVRYNNSRTIMNGISVFLCLFAWLPALYKVVLEIIYSLTYGGVNITQYRRIFFGSILFFLFFSIIASGYYTLVSKKTPYIIGYIGAICSLTMVSANHSYQYVNSYAGYSSLFELGNNTVAMDTLLSGKIPVIDYFSAHALSDIWTRILYCVLNNDYRGIYADPYGWISKVISLVLLFLLASSLLENKNCGVLYVLLFPGYMRGIKWHSICFLCILAVCLLEKKPIKKINYIFWIAALITAFYQYDDGICIGIACITSYAVVMLVQKKCSEIKRFVISGVVVACTAFLLYCAYSLLTGISIVSRMREWLAITVGSNSTWASNNFGNPGSFSFLLSYFVFPLIAVVVCAFSIFFCFKYNTYKLVMVTMVFAVTEILYIPRTIVFHNLEATAGNTGVLLNYTHWTIACFILLCLSIRKHSKGCKVFGFVTAMLVTISIEGLLVTGFLVNTDSVMASSAILSARQIDIKDHVDENIGKNRIVFDNDTELLVSRYKNLFDLLLDKDETYIDFANVTGMYALTGRKRPSYVSQTPSLLTDSFSQACYINGLSLYSCPLAVLGYGGSIPTQMMADVPLNIRYYKIAEYIYANYRPLVRFSGVVIWCASERYDEFKRILLDKDFEGQGYVVCDYGYDFTRTVLDDNGNELFEYQPVHDYDLQMIPYLWGNNDKFRAFDNKVVSECFNKSEYTFSFEGSQETLLADGNYLLYECDNKSADDIKISISACDSRCEGARMKYGFTVLPGKHKYVIRVSSDYFWNVYNIDTLEFQDIEDSIVSIEKVRILAGD